MATHTPYEIKLSPAPQSFFVRLGGSIYYLTFRWNADFGSWMLSIADSQKNAIVNNLPVVTGLDLLAMHRHLGIPGSIVVQTDHDADAVPTFDNLGQDGRVYYVVTS